MKFRETTNFNSHSMEVKKERIDIISIIENAGFKLRRSGTRHVGLCPFHSEKTPSFYVFDDNRFKCFGCGAHGDVIDFVRKINGLSFLDALAYLGISRGETTPSIRAAIKARKRKAELVKAFRKWELRYGGDVGGMIFNIEKLMHNGIPKEDLDLYAPLLHALPIYEYYQYILIYGTDQEKFKLYQEEAQKCRKKGLI